MQALGQGYRWLVNRWIDPSISLAELDLVYNEFMIDSSDPRSAFAGLRDRDYARAGLMVCEGRIVIEKAIACGIPIRSMLCVPADEDEWMGVSGGSFPVAAMPRAEMADLLGFSFHRGTLALADRPELADHSALPSGHALVLWNVTDPDNLGALIRSAAALGAVCIYLGPGCADPYSRKALRASMACALGLPILSLASVQDLAKARGVGAGSGGLNMLVAAALVPGSLQLESFPPSKRPVSLVLGNEGWGLPADLLSACDATVSVPMAGSVDSLNVGAAGAILMWELFRRGYPR
jgi:tRNA G18 (ribose-2'-O)-methylase SpoU